MTLKRTGLALVLASTALAGCGGGGQGANEKRFDGESKHVAAVVDRLQDYARDGDGPKICSELMTPQLSRYIAQSFSTSCDKRVSAQLGDKATTITIHRLRVVGPVASATVSEQNRNLTGMAFVKQDGHWRISRIRG